MVEVPEKQMAPSSSHLHSVFQEVFSRPCLCACPSLNHYTYYKDTTRLCCYISAYLHPVSIFQSELEYLEGTAGLYYIPSVLHSCTSFQNKFNMMTLKHLTVIHTRDAGSILALLKKKKCLILNSEDKKRKEKMQLQADHRGYPGPKEQQDKGSPGPRASGNIAYYSTWCMVPKRGDGRWGQGIPLPRSREVFIPCQGGCSLFYTLRAPLRNG